MIEGHEAKIMTALQQRLECVNLFPSLNISWIGVDFDPTDEDSQYLDARIFPSQIEEMGMENDPEIYHTGIFQVGVVDVTGKGGIKATDIASTIVAHFAKGTAITVLGAVIKISNRPSIGAPIINENTLIVPISIRYSSSQ